MCWPKAMFFFQKERREGARRHRMPVLCTAGAYLEVSLLRLRKHHKFCLHVFSWLKSVAVVVQHVVVGVESTIPGCVGISNGGLVIWFSGYLRAGVLFLSNAGCALLSGRNVENLLEPLKSSYDVLEHTNTTRYRELLANLIIH